MPPKGEILEFRLRKIKLNEVMVDWSKQDRRTWRFSVFAAALVKRSRSAAQRPPHLSMFLFWRIPGENGGWRKLSGKCLELGKCCCGLETFDQTQVTHTHKVLKQIPICSKLALLVKLNLETLKRVYFLPPPNKQNGGDHFADVNGVVLRVPSFGWLEGNLRRSHQFHSPKKDKTTWTRPGLCDTWQLDVAQVGLGRKS